MGKGEIAHYKCNIMRLMSRSYSGFLFVKYNINTNLLLYVFINYNTSKLLKHDIPT